MMLDYTRRDCKQNNVFLLMLPFLVGFVLLLNISSHAMADYAMTDTDRDRVNFVHLLMISFNSAFDEKVKLQSDPLEKIAQFQHVLDRNVEGPLHREEAKALDGALRRELAVLVNHIIGYWDGILALARQDKAILQGDISKRIDTQKDKIVTYLMQLADTFHFDQTRINNLVNALKRETKDLTQFSDKEKEMRAKMYPTSQEQSRQQLEREYAEKQAQRAREEAAWKAALKIQPCPVPPTKTVRTPKSASRSMNGALERNLTELHKSLSQLAHNLSR